MFRDTNTDRTADKPTYRDRTGSDERGVSELLGAIIVFALVIAVLALVQAWAVPAANQQTEFEHNQRVLGDFQQLGSEVDRAAGLDIPGSTTVEAGTRYSPRIFLLNPHAPAGSVQTEDGTVELRNVRATNSETRDYLAGGTPHSFGTKSLTYRPNYNEYGNPPTTRYEGWTLYNDFEDTDIVYNRQGLLTGETLRVTTLDGSISTASQGPIVVPTTPISGPSRTVSVQGVSEDDPVTIQLTTGLPAETWETEILAGEGNLAGVTQVDDETVEIRLRYADENDDPITYSLQMSKVGIGSGTTSEGAHYLTVTGEQPRLTSRGGSVTVSVRDRFNNPVSGVDVTFESSAIGLDETVTSDEEGMATVRFSSPTVDTATITATASVAPDPAGTPAAQQTQQARGTVELSNVPVRFDPEQDTSDSEVNPDDGTTLKFISSVLVGTGNDPRYVDVTFENQGPDTTISQVRVNSYIGDTFSQARGTIIPDQVLIDGGTPYEIGGRYESPTGSFQENIDSGDDATYRFEFRRDGSNYEPNRADFMVYSIKFENGTTSRYFIQMDVR